MDTPSPRRGRPPSDAKHAEILWAAAQLFARRGITATTTREVALQANTTERTLFKHFGSKDGLVQAVLSEAVLAHLAPASLDQLARSVEAFDGDLRAWHRRLLQDRLDALRIAPELTRLLLTQLLRDEGVRGEFGLQWKQAAWQPLVDLFEAQAKVGKLRRDVPPETLARQFLSLNLGFLIPRLLLVPDYGWQDEAEIGAIAEAFARIAAT